MIKSKAVLFILTMFFLAISAFRFDTPPSKFHELSIKSLDGKEEIQFKQFKGKKVMLVNTASECGYTPQYADLEKLYEKYRDKLVIIGFPCNQFGEQEPGTAEEISVFCKSRYSITFPITEKIEVKGDHQHTVYQWLTHKEFNKKEDVNVRWNFGKFLIDEKGKYLGYFSSKVNPLDSVITSLIEQ